VSKIADTLRAHFQIDVDASGSIGRRYRRQDEVGTPFCVTVDFDSLDDDAVTIRERDSMQQVRVPVAQVVDELTERLAR
jgi:glycyl-tRNA synthetase